MRRNCSRVGSENHRATPHALLVGFSLTPRGSGHRNCTRTEAAMNYTRDRTSACCRRRIATVKTSRPGIASALFASTKPRARSSSTTAGSSLRKLPPPNSLISARCSILVSSSQPGASDIGRFPWFLSGRPFPWAQRDIARLRFGRLEGADDGLPDHRRPARPAQAAADISEQPCASV
jgi:hypothetical protein